MDTKEAMKALMSLLLIMLTAGDTRGDVTCTAVTTRVSTNVTCDFGLDIKKIKRNFNVEFYYPDLYAQPETPVACNFKVNGDLICREGSDVTFDRVVSDQVRFSRPSSVDKVGGQYVCHPVPSLDNTHVQPCRLTYKELPTTSQPPPPTTTLPPTTATTTTGSSKPLPHAKDRLQSSVDTIIILTSVAVTLLAVIMLACIVLLLILYRRRHKLRNWWKGSTGHTGLHASWVDERTTIPEPAPVNSTGHHHMADKQTPCSLHTEFSNQEPPEAPDDKDEAKKEKKKRSSVWKRLRGSLRGKGSTRSEDKDEDVTTPEATLQCEDNTSLRTLPEEDISLSLPPEAVTREEAPSSRPLLGIYPRSALPGTRSAAAPDYRVRPSYSYDYSRRY